MARPLTPAEHSRRRKELAALVKQGATRSDLMERYGVSGQTIDNWRQRYGFRFRAVASRAHKQSEQERLHKDPLARFSLGELRPRKHVVRRKKGRAAVPRLEILRLYREGRPIKEICDTLDVCNATVRMTARAAGLRRDRRLTDKQRRALIADRAKGMSGAELATKYGVHEGTVWATLRRLS